MKNDRKNWSHMTLEYWTRKLLCANQASNQHDHEALPADIVFKPYTYRTYYMYTTYIYVHRT